MTPRSWVIRITAAPVSAWRRRKQRQHLGLHGDVERRGGLIGDDQLWLAGHRHGDDGALAHAAGELVGVLPAAAGGVRDIDLGQELHGPGLGIALAQQPMRHLALGHLPADRQHGVEAGRRVLEDHADIAAAQLAQHLGARTDHLGAGEADGASNACRRWQQAACRERRDALAGAGLADDAQHLVRADIEVDAAHRRHRPAGAGEVHLEAANLQNRLSHRRRSSRRMARRCCPGGRDRQGGQLHQGATVIVRATSMLSMSGVKPPTSGAATIRPTSNVLVGMPKEDATSTSFRWS